MIDKPIVICANMQNERHNLERWFSCVNDIRHAGVIIVDSGSTDGTVEYAESHNAVVIKDDIFKREGAAAARNNLLELSRNLYPDSHWMLFLDGDEMFLPADYHRLNFIREYLIDAYDVVMFPRIDWLDDEMTESKNNIYAQPDPQGRMIRLDSSVFFVRKLHEVIHGAKRVFFDIQNPKIHHFNSAADDDRRIEIGKLYAKLHREDEEHGSEVPKHPKEDYFFDLYLKEGLK